MVLEICKFTKPGRRNFTERSVRAGVLRAPATHADFEKGRPVSSHATKITRKVRLWLRELALRTRRAPKRAILLLGTREKRNLQAQFAKAQKHIFRMFLGAFAPIPP